MNIEQFRKMGTEEKLEALFMLVTGGAKTVPAYERPALLPTDVRLIADGQTRNLDGSIWSKRPAIPNRQDAGVGCTIYGYISAVKNPRLFNEMGPAILGKEDWDKFVAGWEKDKYMTYSANPEILLDQGYALPGKGKGEKGEVNFMMFNTYLQTAGSAPQ